MDVEVITTDVRKAIEIRTALETMARFVVPRLLSLDLEWYVKVTDKVHERTRVALPEGTAIQGAMMGGVDRLRELAIAALAFQRAVRAIYPGGVG